MKYSLSKNKTYTVLTLEEEKLDSTVAPELKSELINIQATGTVNMILDLSLTKYIDSSGLSGLLTGNRIFSESDGGGIFIISGASEFVLKLITISQLNNIFNMTATTAEAEEAIIADSKE